MKIHKQISSQHFPLISITSIGAEYHGYSADVTCTFPVFLGVGSKDLAAGSASLAGDDLDHLQD
jgi:hypothetical protein